MKSKFEASKNTNLSIEEAIALSSELANEIVNTDDCLISVEKKRSGYGTWKSVGFANESHFGLELKQIILQALRGKITHDEDYEFNLKDFEEPIQELIFEKIY